MGSSKSLTKMINKGKWFQTNLDKLNVMYVSGTNLCT